MTRSLPLAALAAAAALAAIPAGAGAHDGVPTSASVKAHIKQADRALNRVARHVAAGETADAARAFARHRSEVRRAEGEAAALAGRSAARAASVQRLLANQQSATAGRLAALLDRVTGTLELTLAKGTASSIKGRDRAITALSGLAADLPQDKRAGIAAAIAAVIAKGQTVMATLGETLAGGDVATPARPIVEQALGLATAGIAAVTEHLQALIPLLPAAAQPHVQAALATVTSVVSQVTGLLQQILGPILGATPSAPATGDATAPGSGVTGSLPAAPGVPAELPGLGAIGGGLGGILAGLGISFGR